MRRTLFRKESSLRPAARLFFSLCLCLGLCLFFFAAACFSPPPSHRADRFGRGRSSTREKGGGGEGKLEGKLEGKIFQTFFGVSLYDEDRLSFERESSFDPSVTAAPEYSAVPLIGVAVQAPMAGTTLSAGAEWGALLGWWFDNDSAMNSAGAKILEVRSDLYTGEAFAGGYASADLGEKARIYAGAGPMLLLAVYDARIKETDPAASETFDDDETGLALGAGLYVRAGLEFFWDENSLVGIGVRKVRTGLDFGGHGGGVDLDGVQVMVTWSVRF